MAKIKYTKGELKRQRDNLKLFNHYLPMLQLKKQQLQLKITEVRKKLTNLQKTFDTQMEYIESWAGLLADPRIDIMIWIIPDKILVSSDNIAGVNLPIFKSVTFKEVDYDYYSTPFWIDRGIKELRDVITILSEIGVLNKQLEILSRELRIITQRVNLFEKVKIPESIENIRKIRIYLGDQDANAVGIGKVAKKKIQAKLGEEVFV